MRRIKLKITLIYPATVITSVCVCVYIERSTFPHLEEARSQRPMSLCLGWKHTFHLWWVRRKRGCQNPAVGILSAERRAAAAAAAAAVTATGSSGVPVLRGSLAAAGSCFQNNSGGQNHTRDASSLLLLPSACPCFQAVCHSTGATEAK